MSKDEIDQDRRKFLITASTAAVGVIGAAATAVPFVTSMLPTADVEAAGAPVTVDVSQMQPGEQKTVMWRGKPIWIVRRTQEEIDSLSKDRELLRDPDSKVNQQPPYARNAYRSIKPEFLVLVGVCTHLGCIPTYRPEPGSVNANWPGGFFCTCHGSKYDMAGRVFKDVPAPINLQVPHYTFLSDTQILIGSDKQITSSS
jgi:ubiquinol-cytochrome c reductase iron-sulfur subunit